MLIVIDPGHGGKYRANVGPTGYVEADGVLDISLKLAELLVIGGYNTKLTRTEDKTVELYARSDMANSWGGNLFLSIHTNAHSDPSIGGIEIFHTLNNEWNNQEHAAEAKIVAELVQKHLVEAIGLKNRGLKTRTVNNPGSPIDNKDYYAVIRRSNMPSLIVEAGFHSNPNEEAMLKTEGFRKKIAKAIFNGLKEAYLIKSNEVSTWAKDAWKWGIEGGITDGNSPLSYGTREQFITMLYRYDKLRGGK